MCVLCVEPSIASVNSVLQSSDNTSVGSPFVVVFPIPICPLAFVPQEYTFPLAVTAAEFTFPALIPTTSSPPTFIRTGNVALVVLLFPTCLLALYPHAYSSKSAEIAIT